MTPPGTTLLARLESAADGPGRLTFVTGGEVVERTYSQLFDDARAVAAALQARGVGHGSHVALLGPTSRAFVTAVEATWLAGATVVVLPLPMRLGSMEEFVAQTRGRVRAADTDLLVVDPDLAAFIEPAPDDPPIVLLSELDPDRPGAVPASRYEPPEVTPDDLAILQFTSGSTSDPKGVMLPHRTILANLDGAAQAVELDPAGDVAVSWLPLYHDMGLIGLLTLPLITGTPLVLGAPQDFMGAPARWMQWISDFGGTVSAGPNFAYALAARALKRMSGLDLSRWRLALNGAEPVDPATVRAFCEAGAQHGLRPEAAFPAFGMAEVAIAGAFPPLLSGLRTDRIDGRVLETDRYAAPVEPSAETARELALLGRPIPGLEMRVCDPETGDEMREREVGELQLRGTSVTPGYYKHEAATAHAFRDGWFRTGDLAYVVGGELVICGRIKDVIIVGGRNIFPEDVERAAAAVDGVRAGNVIAFGIEGRKGKEGLVVVAETRSPERADEVRQLVAVRVRDAIGLPPEEVVLVDAGTLPKTSSGKPQRSLCRSRYLESSLALI